MLTAPTGHPYKITEVVTAIKALETALVCALAQQRYGASPVPRPVDVEHAALFVLAPSIPSLNGRPASDPFLPVRDCDIHDTYKHRYRQLCSAVYRTGDARFFQLHGGVDARSVQDVIGVPPNRVDLKDRETIVRFYAEGVSMCESQELDAELASKGLGGTICYTAEGEYLRSSDANCYQSSGNPTQARPLPTVRYTRCRGYPVQRHHGRRQATACYRASRCWKCLASSLHQ